jgi:hypothetical protein
MHRHVSQVCSRRDIIARRVRRSGGCTHDWPDRRNSDRSHRWLYVSGGANESAVVAYDLSAPGMPLVETITQGINYSDGIDLARRNHEATKALFVTDCLGGTQEYILGNPYPVENLVEPFPSDNLAIGRVDHHHLTLFAPSLFTGEVVFYDVTTTPYETLQTSFVEALGVLYKPAGIPL